MTEGSYRHVAVAIDGSPAASAAIDVALKFIERGGEMAFIHTVNRSRAIENFVPRRAGSLSASEFIDAFERQLFHNARLRAAVNGVRATQTSINDDPGRGISGYVRTHGTDLLVMGTHSDAGLARTALGSTAQEVVRLARVPTVVTSDAGRSTLEAGIRNVLVAIDGSLPAYEAIECGIALAHRNGADIQFVNVAERLREQRTSAAIAAAAACEQAARAGVRATAFTLHGSPAEAICAAVDVHAADVVVIGTHGRTGAARRRTSSVAEAVVRLAPCPVMVVPGRHTESPQHVAKDEPS